jgi:2-dehydro-3-deoxy-D-gluconate 5-dehydrogenase
VSFKPPSFDLSGKIALVTGGNRGIGRAIALGLASAGAQVAIAARDQLKAAAVVDEVVALGGHGIALELDVMKREQLPKAVEEVTRQLGGLDILVNNAGNVDLSGGILTQSEQGWDTTVATHLDATFLLSKYAAQAMQARGGGKIINLASMYSYFGAGALPAYGAVKGGIVQLTKAMAVELAPHNIQVNAIAPGWIATDMTAGVRDDQAFEAWNAMLMARTPAGRWGEPDECAGAIVFLSSPAAQFVTGVILPVDGGYSVC